MFSEKSFVTIGLVILATLHITDCSAPTDSTPITVTGVTLYQTTLTLTALGATGTLVATVTPVNASNKNVTWSSSTSTVATVTNGVITPVAAGTTTIMITTIDGGLTATCIVTVNPLVAIGESYGGGIVAYILQSGDQDYNANVQRGLIATTTDQSTGSAWSNVITTLIGTTGTAIGTGLANTTAIIGQSGHISSSAKICYDYLVTVESITYDDWFLPSKYELDKLYINKGAIGGFTGNYYWSSSEYGTALNAWHQDFDSGTQLNTNKNSSAWVRAVRNF